MLLLAHVDCIFLLNRRHFWLLLLSNLKRKSTAASVLCDETMNFLPIFIVYYIIKKFNLISVYFQVPTSQGRVRVGDTKSWALLKCALLPFLQVVFLWWFLASRALERECLISARTVPDLARIWRTASPPSSFLFNKHYKGLQPFWLLPSSSSCSLMTMMGGSSSYIFKLRSRITTLQQRTWLTLKNKQDRRVH